MFKTVEGSQSQLCPCYCQFTFSRLL